MDDEIYYDYYDAGQRILQSIGLIIKSGILKNEERSTQNILIEILSELYSDASNYKVERLNDHINEELKKIIKDNLYYDYEIEILIRNIKNNNRL